MNILLIGNDARTNAVAEALDNSAKSPKIFSFMASLNPGIAKLSEDTQIGSYEDLDAIKAFATANNVDFAFIGPEAPLAAGVVDELEKVNIKSVGPVKELARLETSKAFTRELAKQYDIPGQPEFQTCENEEEAKKFIETVDEIVVKPDGLTGGKGVMVQGDHFESKEAGLKIALDIIKKEGRVVLEEKLIGEEFSLQSLCDGKHLFDFPPVQDHKRAFNDDKGPNTGGMGSYSTGKLLPFMTEKHLEEAHTITQKMVEAISKETGTEYKGVMYGGFIATKEGVKVIEYNVRFGDPEAMNVLPLLKTDFVEVCKAVIDGTLDKVKAEFKEEATVCKYAVPKGYPTNPCKGERISLKEVRKDAKIYYASVDQKEDGIYMTGSRAIAFVGIHANLEEAQVIAEDAVSAVVGPVFHRDDIGTKELIDKKIEHMKNL